MRIPNCRLALLVALVTLIALRSPSAVTQNRERRADILPDSVSAVAHDLSPSLRSMPVRSLKEVVADSREINRHGAPEGLGIPADRSPQLEDPVRDFAKERAPAPAPFLSFDGVPNVNWVHPPDPNGDVGKDHYVQWVNLSFQVFDKVTGASVLGPLPGNSIWSGFGGTCESNNNGDPIVLYDRLADRWLLSQFAIATDGHQCIAVSETGDPTGAYYRYDFVITTGGLNDYPKFAVWPDAYYLMVNEFTPSFSATALVAFDRDKMLAGDPSPTGILFRIPPDTTAHFGVLPANPEGLTPPAVGRPGLFVQAVDAQTFGGTVDRYNIWELQPDFTDPFSSTLTLTELSAGVPSFDSNLCVFSSTCVPQPGTIAKIDALGQFTMYRPVYRNFITHEVLLVNHTVDVGLDHAGIRWAEIRDPFGAPSVYQTGTYAPDSNHRWSGSIAMDGKGNIALGYSVSSTSTYPSIRYAGRLRTDTLGTLPRGEGTLVSGSCSQLADRWGDYTSMSIDEHGDPGSGVPRDCAFWYTNEYIGSGGGSAPWRTRVGAFRFPECTEPQLTNLVVGLGSGSRGWLESVDPSTTHQHVGWPRVGWGTYNQTGGGSRPALCNVDGDAAYELVLGLGPGSGGWVEVKDDAGTGYATLRWLQVRWSTYNGANGETFPACGDLDGDGRDEIVLGLGNGGGGWVQAFDDATTSYAFLPGTPYSQGWIRSSYVTYNNGRGEVHPAVGNLDNDSRDELVLGLGQDGRGWVQVLDDASAGFAPVITPAPGGWLRVPWSSYNNSNGTTWPAVGDVNGDGRGELVLGLGEGAGGWIYVVENATTSFAPLTSSGWQRVGWSAYNTSVGATYPAAGDVDGDRLDEIVIGFATYPTNGGWFEVLEDLHGSLAHRSWGRVQWTNYNGSNGETRPVGGRS